MKDIFFTAHSLSHIPRRGFTKEEVIETIQNETWIIGDFGKQECRKNFIYNKTWNGKFYKTKQVRPIFSVEDKIIVITVYAYYF